MGDYSIGKSVVGKRSIVKGGKSIHNWPLHVKFKMKIKWKTKKNKEKEALNFNILKEPRGILKCLEIVSESSPLKVINNMAS